MATLGSLLSRSSSRANNVFGDRMNNFVRPYVTSFSNPNLAMILATPSLGSPLYTGHVSSHVTLYLFMEKLASH